MFEVNLAWFICMRIDAYLLRREADVSYFPIRLRNVSLMPVYGKNTEWRPKDDKEKELCVQKEADEIKETRSEHVVDLR